MNKDDDDDDDRDAQLFFFATPQLSFLRFLLHMTLNFIIEKIKINKWIKTKYEI